MGENGTLAQLQAIVSDSSHLADHIDALLPQTQCTRCGYPSCRDYAQAIADDAAAINQCPPGGAAGIAALARLLDREAVPLNPVNGVETPRTVAFIDEAACIGCTKCIQACPVDAILGASKFMHTVIAEECTGCELCVAPCPVDCITMIPARDADVPAANRAPQYRRRFEARNARLQRLADEHAKALAARKAGIDTGDAVAAALARARARKFGVSKPQ
jgi:electron transport complex protein RnfB